MGAIYNISGSRPVLANCSFQGNQATGGVSNYGGAMYNSGSSNPVLTNSVVWNNGGGNTFANLGSSTLTATYSLFDNTTGVDVTGPGNLTTPTSPFATTATTQLAANSPAINAGDVVSYTAVAGPPADLAGNPRFVGANYAIDMGAYEDQSGSPVSVLIVQQPPSASVVCAGVAVTVSVSVTGTSPTYQWYRNGVPQDRPILNF